MMRFKSIKHNIDLLLTVAVGLIVRLRVIGSEEFWFDEAFTGILMRVPSTTFWEVASTDVNPPIYYLLLKVWGTVFGTSVTSLRAFSVLAGLLTIVVMYHLVKKLFNKEAAVISAFLVAISPFFTWFSVEARSYSLYGLFVLASIYFFVSKKYWHSVALFILGILTHYMAILYIAPYLMLGILRYLKGESIKKLSWFFVPLISAGALLYYYGQSTKESFNNGWVQKATVSNLASSIYGALFGIKSKLAGANEVNDINFFINKEILGWILFALILVGLVFLAAKHWKEKSELVRHLTIPAFIFIPQITLIAYGLIKEQNLYLERYLYPSALFVLIAVAVILNKVLSFEVTALTLIFYVFLVSRVIPHDYYNGMREVTDLYKSSNKTLVFTSPIDFVVGRYYLGENFINTRIYNPDEPENTYEWWPFVENTNHAQNLKESIIISPANYGEDYVQINGVDDYKVYVKKNP